MNLLDAGFRFVIRNGSFMCLHPTDVDDSDVDCTFMSDEEFERTVIDATGAGNE